MSWYCSCRSDRFAFSTERGTSSFGTSSQQRSFGILGRGGPDGWAGFFDGKAEVVGPLIKSGGGFKIDHPLEPERKHLSHSFVESAEMKNVYDGVVGLDANGECCVELPEWFEALNCDFRYQLTSIGGPAPNLHIAREVSNNRFNIAGGKSKMKVSWQVTGIRKDSWARAHPLIVEEEKPADAQGYYRHPELFGLPAENSTFFKGNSELRRRLEEQRGLSSKEVDQPRTTEMAHLGKSRARLEEEWRRVEELVQRTGPTTLAKPLVRARKRADDVQTQNVRLAPSRRTRVARSNAQPRCREQPIVRARHEYRGRQAQNGGRLSRHP